MLGNILKELRKQKRMTQKDLAQAMRVSQQTVGAWETERAIPGADTLNDLADYFNVTTDYLLGRPEKELDEKKKTISEAIDTAMTNDGRELDQHDKDVIKSLVEAYLNNKK